MNRSAATTKLAILSALVTSCYARYAYYTDHAPGDLDAIWEKACPQLQLAEQFQSEVSLIEAELRIQNEFSFDSTGDAYDACQSDFRIKNGDLLIIESEKVIGLANTWPVAVTYELGALHQVKVGNNAKDVLGIPEEFIIGAIKAAIDRGYPLDINFSVEK